METTSVSSLVYTSTRTHKTMFQRAVPYLLIAPTLILVFMFTIYPAARTLIDSTYEFIPPGRAQMLNKSPRTFVGLQNYTDLFDQTHFLGSRFLPILKNTLVFTAGTVLLSLPLALLMALLLNRRIRLMALWRFSLFYPALLPLVGAASIWAFLYADTVGLINTVLRSFGIGGTNWVGDPGVVLWAIIIVNVWKQAGYYMIFYLAGLQGIPKDIYESAALDGAGTFQQLYYLTLPLLRRTTLFLIVVSSTFAFQTVEQLQALNRGNPADKGNLLLYYIFQNLPSVDARGYTNAMTVILVGLLLVFTMSNFLLFEGAHEDE